MAKTYKNMNFFEKSKIIIILGIFVVKLKSIAFEE